MPVGLLVVSAVITRGPKPTITMATPTIVLRPLVWEGNYPHRRAHHIDRRLLSSLLIDDDGLVATRAVGEVVSGRLFVHDGNARWRC